MRDLVLDSLVKATLLLGAAGALTVLWRRAAAAHRHIVWVMALCGVLILPAAESLGPAWGVALLPRRAALTVASAGVAPPAPTAAPRRAEPAATGGSRRGSAEITGLPVEPAAPRMSLAEWLLAVWLGGMALVLGAFGAARLRVALLAECARPIASADWLDLLDSLRAQLDLSRRVRLLAAPGPAMPMTWGIRRPVVLLPAAAEQWSAARRRDVLLHELTHVERRDCLTQLVAVVACAAYWFHPLVWIAARRLRIERERACDDRVLAAGAKPSEYAEHLLEIARTLRVAPATALASVAMARPSHLAGRLLDVLDPARRRDALTRRLAAPAAFGAALVVLPLAALRPVAPAQRSTVDRSLSSPAELTPARRLPLRPATTGRSVRAAEPDSACQSQSSKGTSSTRSESAHRDDHSTQLVFKIGRCVAELRARGEFRFTADFSDIGSIDAGGSVVLERRVGDVKRRVEMEPGSGGVTHRWFVDDRERPYDAEARAWLAATLTELLRHTGYAAESRSHWILQTRGVDGLFAEIDQLSGDYTRRIYYQAMVADGKLDLVNVARVVTRAGSEISSDYDLAELLVLVARTYTLTEPLRAAFVAAADHLDSDYDHHRVLAVVLAGRDLPDGVATAVLASAGHLQSDYDLAEVLIVLIQKHSIGPGMSAAFFQAVDGIDSDYDRHRVLSTLLAQHDAPGPAMVAAALTSAGHIASNYDRAEVLVQVAESYGVDEATRAPFFAAADALSSDYDHGRVLTALINRPESQLTPSVATAVIASARRLGSDYERANVLVAVARHLRLSGELRRAFVDAANGIGSEHDRNRVLAALEGSTQLD